MYLRLCPHTLWFRRVRDSTKYHTYRLPADVGHYVIPRPDFVLFSEMEIYVKAVNELGETASAPLTLEPMSVGKYFFSWASSNGD